MSGRRKIIAWILIILSALVLYLFSNESVTLALLIAVIIALPVSFVIFRLTAGRLEMSIEEGEAAEGRKSFVLVMKNSGVLPVASASAEVKCANLRTGEADSYTVSRSVMPKRIEKITLDIMASHAGRYELSVDEARVTDPLGIWSRGLRFDGSRGITVMPDIFDMRMLSAGISAMPESDSQSHKVRGAVAGDMIGIREYVPGDPVRNIHWKLSEKTDKLLVKELGESISDRFLIILDNAADIAQDPVALDAVASVYASLIHTLRLNDMSCYAGWTDPETGRAEIRLIADDSDASAAADEYLAVPARMPSAFRSIERDMADKRYAHVVIVGSRIPANIENITNGCQATVLRYGDRASFNEKNLTVIGFEAQTYMNDTAGVEI